ncbi:MAG: CoA transferase [Dehalococcoidia bacterium]|nr:CoA transferase [Dehalococcoidia bacterium]MDP6510865.1 CoA transferase [Dehalococcoidia bacterium]
MAAQKKQISMPLEGIRVLDWTAFQQGPIAACLLADMGADVIKIEEPRGEPARGLIQAYGIKMPMNFYYQNQNRGKRGMVINLQTAKGKDVLYRLVEKSDVFVTNYRESICQRLQVDCDTLTKHNPQLIYAYSSGYGPLGPDANLASADFAGQARGGLWSVSRARDMSWAPVGAGQADEMGGVITAYGIILALLARERSGIGQRVDGSLLGGQMELGRLSFQQQLMGLPPAPSSIAMLRSPLYNLYECQDGKWICFAVLQADRYWHQFCEALGIPEMEKDSRFENATVRGEHLDELMPTLQQRFQTRPRNDWVKTFHQAGVEQVAPVQDYADLAEDPQMIANEYVVTVDDAVHGKVRVPGIPVKLSKTPGKVTKLAPELGQHTEEVLQEVLDMSWEEIGQLREEGVF